jgi:DNA polymerase-3 subunit gamma/tau
MTINGYKKMKDILVGDKLIDGLGNSTIVTGIYPQGIKPIYKITFSDRTSTLCSDEHIWKVGSYSNYKGQLVWKNMTVKELLQTGLRKANNKGWKYRIPVPQINCWEDNISIDPYLLGYLIGDGDLGSSKSIKVSIYENDIFEKIDNILKSIGYKLHLCNSEDNLKKDYNIVQINFEYSNQFKDNTGFVKYIQKLNLRCNSLEKHIPKEYLFSSIECRQKLLQGLFDADGYIDHANNYVFTTSSSQLSADFAFLVRSLGGTDTVVEKPSAYKKNGKTIVCENHFDHTIKFENDFQFCSSNKHLNKIKPKQNGPQRRIIDIEYVGEQQCQCIMVDSEDHTYMTNDLIVTHNTTTARIIANMINEGKGKPIELDCASHNGVDDMREILEECHTRPLIGKYKIFLMDECHMLTVQAWNSLLKVLEEPPSYVIFLFCTTDPQKIIQTILSRVQRFNFSRISTEGIIKRLKYIISQENKDYLNDTSISSEELNERQKASAQGAVYINYEEEAVEYLARLAKGGMRDAITSLEKCLDYSTNLTLENVHKVMSGGVDEETLLKMMRLILDKNAKASLLCFNEIYMSGIDTSLFLKLYIEYLENCIKFIITQQPNIVPLSEISLSWLRENSRFLDDMRNQLMSTLKIKMDYLSEDLKIIIESWIVQECK